MFGIVDAEVFLPDKRISVGEMAALSGESEAELLSYLQVEEKPIVDSKNDIFELGFLAAKRLLARRPQVSQKIRLVVTGTTFLDRKLVWYPSAVAIKRLGLSNAFGFDVQHGCGSAILSLNLCKSWMADKDGYALIILSDRLSELIDYRDINHKCIFNFSDGASAILLGANSLDVKMELGRSEFSTDATLSESQFLNRSEMSLWINDDPNEDRILIETYRKHYLQNISRVVCSDSPYTLIINQGDFKLIRFLEENLENRPLKIFRTYKKFGHVGNTDIVMGIKEILENSKVFGPQIVLASSAIGYSFSAMALRNRGAL